MRLTDAGAVIEAAHGSGGRAMHRLIESVFLPSFDNPHLAARHDGAALETGGAKLAFTTDAYVVRPLIFPGGDIGSLAVHGTVNDLAMCGARAKWLGAAFILEEGLPVATLRRVVESAARAAAAAGVAIVCGDTKVVERGRADGMYISMSGIGVRGDRAIEPSRVRPGDAVILSGDIGRHGIAVMSARDGLGLETDLASDSCSLADPVTALLDAGIDVHCLRDATRGGLATALTEIAETAGVHAVVQERLIAVCDAVRGACELLGLDPLHVANEGRFVAFVAPGDAERAVTILRGVEASRGAARIGVVEPAPAGRVSMFGLYGTERILDMPTGELLPRIC